MSHYSHSEPVIASSSTDKLEFHTLLPKCLFQQESLQSSNCYLASTLETKLSHALFGSERLLYLFV